MQLHGKAVRVIIYIGESNRYQGKDLSMALLQFLKQQGASGATVVRGLAGFGAHSRIHTANIVDLSADLPLRLEWVDQREIVERLLPQIRQIVNDGLITLEEVEVVQYAPGRRTDPLAQPVSDMMRREVTSVLGNVPLSEVVTLFWQRGYRSVPVVDVHGRLQGILTDGDLLRQINLTTRLDLQTEFSPDQLHTYLANFRQRSQLASDLMVTPVITVHPTDPVRQAVAIMVDRGLKRLPVVEEDGRLVGWISRVDVLRTVEYHQASLETAADAPQAGNTIENLMYRDVPTVPPSAQLEEILQALERTQRRRVLVVDNAQRILGIITDGDLLRRSQAAHHPGLLERLRHLFGGQAKAAAVALPDTAETAANLMTSPVITITTTTPLAEALRLMLYHQIKRLPVVDENGRLLGLLGRASLLHGLLAD